jgi:hypothetical protein
MQRENLFRVDLDKEDMTIDREEFILRRESAAVRAERARLNERLTKEILKKGVSAGGVFGICLMACICCVVTAFMGYLENKVVSVLPLCLAAFFLGASVVFGVIKKARDKKNEGKAPVFSTDSEFDRLDEISEQELRVPKDAKTVELFGCFYNKDSAPDAPYDVDEVDIFEENGMLCLHHVGFVIGVPIDSIEAVVKVEDTVTFSDWMKDEPHDSEKYAPYHITMRQVNEYEEEYSMDGYYSIRFSKDGNPFELIVPLYEIEPLLEILKIEVTKEERFGE